MFQYDQFKLGKHQLITFFDERHQNEFTLCLNKGGTWISLVLNGTSILDGYQTEAELDDLQAAKNVMLFPFVNRLKDGYLNWQGQIYEWPINDVNFQHAIHGFGMNLPMQMSIQSLSPLNISLYCYYPGHYFFYPFAFELKTTYQLNHCGEFKVSMKVKNRDKLSFPFAMGFHPYFQFFDSIDSCYMDIPSADKLQVDNRMIPTGNVEPIQATQHMSLMNKYFDDCFHIKPTKNTASIRLYDNKKSLTLWQLVGKYGLNYLQLYTPPHRQCIAIEPMTSAINGLNNRHDSLIIEPDDSRDIQWGIFLQDV